MLFLQNWNEIIIQKYWYKLTEAATFSHRFRFIVCELDKWARDLNTYFTLVDCLIEAVKWTRNANHDKFGYSGYDIKFDARSQFSLANDKLSKNVVIFGVDNISSI